MSFDNATQSLEERFRGRLIRPTDIGFDEARTIYNAMIDKHPALIARCADVADVLSAVRFANDQDLEVAIRSGGHNGPGLALVDDGLVIDLSALKGIRVDPEARAVRVEPGCVWGDVDHATHAFGLATVSGVIGTTGVGGLTLGGGHGYLSRRHGLTIDNLLGADVVLSSGELVKASETQNPELFWALRGGGGNFGVVTSFEYRLHPVDTVIAGPVFWPIEALEQTLRWYREWLPAAHRDLYAFYLTAEVPSAPPFPADIHGRKVCGVMFCCLGSEQQARAAVDAARGAAKPVFEHVARMPYPALQSMFDGLYPPGLQWYWKGHFVREVSDEAIAVHRRFAEVPTAHSTAHLYPVDGAVHDTPAAASPWAHRDATWSMVIAGVDPEPGKVNRIKQWSQDFWRELQPYCQDGAYVNFMMEESAERIRATYGSNFPRLREIKKRVDPANLFHVNQNIPPAA